MFRFAFSEPSIGSTTTRSVGERAESALAELLRDEVEVQPLLLVQPLQAGDDRILRRCVDLGRLVAADARAEDGLALDPRRHAREDAPQVLDRGAAERRATGRSSWLERVEEQAREQLGIEVGALLRHRLAARRDLEDVFDPSRPHQHGDRRLALVDRANGLAPVGRVRETLVAEPVDELDVELASAPSTTSSSRRS